MRMENINEIMIHAARVGETEVIAELLRRGTSTEVRDEKGYTPLIIACYNNRKAAAEMLLDAGADVHLTMAATQL
jgi:uncharacterized protein